MRKGLAALPETRTLEEIVDGDTGLRSNEEEDLMVCLPALGLSIVKDVGLIERAVRLLQIDRFLPDYEEIYDLFG